jgi:hypothetical protein
MNAAPWAALSVVGRKPLKTKRRPKGGVRIQEIGT